MLLSSAAPAYAAGGQFIYLMRWWNVISHPHQVAGLASRKQKGPKDTEKCLRAGWSLKLLLEALACTTWSIKACWIASQGHRFDLQAITVSEAAYWWCNYQQQFELADLRVISCDFLLFSTCKQGRFLGMLAFLAAKPIRNSRRFVLVISCLLNPILGSWTTTMGQSQHCCTGQAQLDAAHWWWFSAAM